MEVKKIQTEKVVYYSETIHKSWYFFIGATDSGVCYVSINSHNENKHEESLQQICKGCKIEENETMIKNYMTQLIEYVEGKRQQFNVSFDVLGSPFQKTVWKALTEVPYGETSTYSELAEKISNPLAVRAVASAIGKNPILIFIPCHRIIRKNGELSGFRDGVEAKRKLLKLEAEISRSAV